LNTGVPVSISFSRETSASRIAASPLATGWYSLPTPRRSSCPSSRISSPVPSSSSTSIQPASWVNPKIRTSTGGRV
jgi:hypothetical protein